MRKDKGNAEKSPFLAFLRVLLAYKGMPVLIFLLFEYFSLAWI